MFLKSVICLFVYAYCLREFLCTRCLEAPEEAEDGLGFPGGGLEVDSRGIVWCWGLNPSPLQESPRTLLINGVYLKIPGWSEEWLPECASPTPTLC